MTSGNPKRKRGTDFRGNKEFQSLAYASGYFSQQPLALSCIEDHDNHAPFPATSLVPQDKRLTHILARFRHIHDTVHDTVHHAGHARQCRTLRRELKPGRCQILSIRNLADHPQVIGTSRHITQGLIDLHAENWNGKTKTLSGQSWVIAGDPYELRLVLPTDMSLVSAQFDQSPKKIVSSKSGTGRVQFVPTASGKVNWTVQFK